MTTQILITQKEKEIKMNELFEQFKIIGELNENMRFRKILGEAFDDLLLKIERTNDQEIKILRAQFDLLKRIMEKL